MHFFFVFVFLILSLAMIKSGSSSESPKDLLRLFKDQESESWREVIPKPMRGTEKVSYTRQFIKVTKDGDNTNQKVSQTDPSLPSIPTSKLRTESFSF